MNLANLFLKKGYLIQPDLINFITLEEGKILLDILIALNSPKMVSLNFIKNNKDKIISALNSFIELGKFDKNIIFNFKQKIEKSFEITFEVKKKEQKNVKKIDEDKLNTNYEEVYDIKKLFMPKKVEVRDFVDFFKYRYNYFKNLLKDRAELNNLISIDKLPKSNQNISVIGIVYSKRETKNKNIILEIEDIKGNVSVLINKNKQDLYNKAINIVEDEVIGVRGFGNREIIFASDIIFPEIINVNLAEKKIKIDKNILFISDIHIGSNKFLENNFKKFIKWVNNDLGNEKQRATAKKISHIFISGDLVDGVGIYPGQEDELEIKDIKEQYKRAYELFDEINKDIKLIFLPGNHDAVRLVEPQIFSEYAKSLEKLENAELIPNPSYYNVYGYRIFLYHGYSFDYYANNVQLLKEQKAYENPESILRFLISKRHIAPTHGSTTYMPCEEDFFIIKKIPDIAVSSHVHKTGTGYYRNILLISTSCWQARTPFQEKVGHIPDPCKVPIFNTKTKKLNIIDFN